MLTLSPGARLSKSQDGGILLDLDHGVFFSLNPVGARIVELLQGASGLPSIVQVIVREFRTPEEIVKNDVDNFLASLRKQQLVAGDEAVGQSPSGDE
jgi:Coenzyme PQQ synthesis protein D (PqqD)